MSLLTSSTLFAVGFGSCAAGIAGCGSDRSGGETGGTGSDLDSTAGICEAGKRTCARGVVATCGTNGNEWHYESCPRGLICDRDACVPNLPTVVIAANTAIPDEGAASPFVPQDLLEDAKAERCRASPSCCGAFRDALESGTNKTTVVMGKHWIARLVADLSAKTRRIVLLGPPTVANASACEEIDRAQRTTCVGGSERLMSVKDFQNVTAQLYQNGTPEYDSGLPAWASDGTTTAGFSGLMKAIVKGDSLDEHLGLEESVNGLWLDSASTEQSELTLGPAEAYPMTMLTYMYIARELRAAGRACSQAADCAVEGFECSEAKCVDTAESCRQYDVVYVAPFVDPVFPHWATEDCGGGPGEGVDYNVWSLWMRWGVGCSKAEPCPPGSLCENVCNFTSFEPCAERSVCVPQDVHFDATQPDPLSPRLLGDFTGYFPSLQPEDAAGSRFSVRTHSILNGVNPSPDPYLLAFGALDYASVAAVVGDGIAVTPCPPGLDLASLPQSDYYSCDYETAYLELVERIAGHGSSVLCTPEMVGLPTTSPSWLD